MSEKSYVTMEQHACIVCGKEFDTGAILLDKRMRERFDRHTVTGLGMCEEHTAKREEGYIALIEIDPTKSQIAGNTAKADKAYRTGNVIFIKREAWSKVFDTPVPETPVAYIDPEASAQVERIVKGEA